VVKHIFCIIYCFLSSINVFYFFRYGTYNQLYSVLHKYINPRDNILVGGCGNSTLSADLYNAGFTYGDFPALFTIKICLNPIYFMLQLYDKC